mmetsp:Transcript_13794/g.57649  ORF Transcript_13794/g.57649 Transcript_13794/m.57649 type:complete len:266 (+) Transcript_13794:45-842(+)
MRGLAPGLEPAHVPRRARLERRAPPHRASVVALQVVRRTAGAHGIGHLGPRRRVGVATDVLEIARAIRHCASDLGQRERGAQPLVVALEVAFVGDDEVAVVLQDVKARRPREERNVWGGEGVSAVESALAVPTEGRDVLEERVKGRAPLARVRAHQHCVVRRAELSVDPVHCQPAARALGRVGRKQRRRALCGVAATRGELVDIFDGHQALVHGASLLVDERGNEALRIGLEQIRALPVVPVLMRRLAALRTRVCVLGRPPLPAK